jgi:hypothetical protein
MLCNHARTHPLTLLRSFSTLVKLFLFSLVRASSTCVGALKLQLNPLTSAYGYDGESRGDILAYP